VTPIEAAARAIAAENFRRQFGHAPSPGWNADRQWRQHIPAARAAIEAIRAPSDEMIEAGQAEGYSYPGGVIDFAAVWTAMLKTALAEQPETAP